MAYSPLPLLVYVDVLSMPDAPGAGILGERQYYLWLCGTVVRLPHATQVKYQWR
jgi:hypothetical protein